MTDRIKIADATPAQLRDFGANTLGLALPGRDTTPMMMRQFAAAGYHGMIELLIVGVTQLDTAKVTPLAATMDDLYERWGYVMEKQKP